MKKQMPKALKQPIKREEVPEEYRWDLSPLYQDEEAFERDFQTVQEMLKEVAELPARFSQSAEEMLACLRYKERFERLLEKAYLYASLKRDEDNTNAKYVALQDRAQNLAVAAGEAFSWLAPAILAMPQQKLEEWLQQDNFMPYRKSIQDILKRKPHILPEREEALLAATGQISGIANDAFTMLNNADITFADAIDQNGQSHSLTQGSYMKLMQSEDRELRKSAFTNLYASYEKQKNTIAALLSGAVKRDCFYAKARRFPSALEAALFDEDIPTPVYDNLIAAVREALPEFHRYLELRKAMLGVEELHMYDLYAPLIDSKPKRIPYEEAKTLVAAGLKPLGEKYGQDLQAGLEGGWVDVYENIGKTSGAYSSGVYDSNPYVLLNYQENLNSVFTLAHEMGHSMHSFYSKKEQPYANSSYTIFLAEIASTVNENLLLRDLLAKATDKREKLMLLNHFLEDFRATVFRQTMFAEFEKIIHEEVEKGGALTEEFMSQVYLQLNADYFGPDVVLDEPIALEWARIPHFYRGFYVYKYATGFSAAIAFAGRILQGEPQAVEKYLGFLAAGDSDTPLAILQKAGLDMSSPAPITAALQEFSAMMQEMENLL